MTIADIEVLPPDAERDRHHAIWNQVDVVRRLSDRLIGIGPFGLGLDGMLTVIPLVGGLYSVSAGLFLLVQAVRARASGFTLGRMAAYLVIDAATSEVPIVGDALDILWPAHQMAARALQKDIERRHGAPARPVGRRR